MVILILREVATRGSQKIQAPRLAHDRFLDHFARDRAEHGARVFDSGTRPVAVYPVGQDLRQFLPHSVRRLRFAVQRQADGGFLIYWRLL